MISESLYFNFAGRKSTDFNIMNINVQPTSMYTEPVIANKTINEIYVKGNDIPYFVYTKKDPLTLQLSFAFEDTWDDTLIDEVIRWLNVDFYQPLYFSEDINRIFYVMPVNGVNLIHNGLKEGYLTLTMRCDSPFTYSPEIITPWYNCLDSTGGTFISPYQWVDTSDSSSGTIIEFYNNGHYSLYPEIWIQKTNEDGDISIFNLTNKNTEFKFTNLQKDEELYIDCENQYMETSLVNTYRYDAFNDNYLELVYGKNTLMVTGNVNLKFRYRYIYS